MDPASILEQIELQIANVKEESLAGKKYLKRLRNGWLHVKRRVGLRNITGMTIDTMLGEVLIWLSSVLRKVVIWLIKCQVWWRLWLPKPWHENRERRWILIWWNPPSFYAWRVHHIMPRERGRKTEAAGSEGIAEETCLTVTVVETVGSKQRLARY